MSHKEEAERLIEHAGEGHGDQGFGAMQDLLKAQAIAQMLLVEAQEAANEQARIANLIALTEWGYRINSEAEWFDQATDALLTGASFIDDSHVLQPEIARALGIGGAE